MFCLTLDVEDWFQSTLDLSAPVGSRVVANTEQVLDTVRKHRVLMTCFVQGMVAEKFPDLVRRISGEGHEIASHGWSHRPLKDIGPEGFRAEVRESRRLLERLCGRPVVGYRAPDFAIGPETLWALDVLATEGYRYDSSIFPIANPRYGIPGWPRTPVAVRTVQGNTIAEFPLATVRVAGVNIPVAGGGYLRLFPFFLMRCALDAITRVGATQVLYFHPYELNHMELARERSRVPLKTYLTQNTGRRSFRRKIEALCCRYSFETIGQRADASQSLAVHALAAKE